MADIEALNLIIKADATAGLNQVTNSLNQAANAGANASKQFDEISKTSYTTRFAVQNVANVFRDLPYASSI
jgi:hypothetical protein